MSSLVLAIDGGGTGTRVVVCDRNGTAQARGKAGTSNVTTVGVRGMVDAVYTALQDAGVKVLNQFKAVWAGFAGIGAEDSTVFNESLAALQELFELGGDQITLTTDANLLAAPLVVRDDVTSGVGMIAGTGSVAMAFKGKQMQCRAGGWGHLLGDEGSGYYVGLQALKSVVQVNDQIVRSKISGVDPPEFSPWQTNVLNKLQVEPGTNLHIRVLNKLNATSLQDSSTKLQISGLCRLVFEGGIEDNDSRASQIIADASGWLAELVLALVPPVDPNEGALVLGGSLMGVKKFREMVLKEVERRGTVFKHVDVVDDPAYEAAKALAKENFGTISR